VCRTGGWVKRSLMFRLLGITFFLSLMTGFTPAMAQVPASTP
jgi:hypothetical protein